MLIGIVGYFTVPGIANYIINVGGHALLNKTSGLASTAVAFTTGQITQAIIERERDQDRRDQMQPRSDPSGGGSSSGSYMQDKLSGKT